MQRQCTLASQGWRADGARDLLEQRIWRISAFDDPELNHLPRASAWQRMREKLGTRATGVILTLLLEGLLLLALLTLGQTGFQPAGDDQSIVSFDVSSSQDEEADSEDSDDAPEFAAPSPSTQQAEPEPEPARQPPVLATRSTPAPRQPIIQVSPEEMRNLDISDLPRRRPDAPSGPAYGPAAPASAPGDSEVVGTAPDGEPLYAARWYTEPTDQEMAGYLSTARPGRALIACRTAPNWRVEDCVGLEEYPTGTNLQRAVLAATWQFMVRPPRRGGQSLVGSWVRIRIDYSTRGPRTYP